MDVTVHKTRKVGEIQVGRRMVALEYRAARRVNRRKAIQLTGAEEDVGCGLNRGANHVDDEILELGWDIHPWIGIVSVRQEAVAAGWYFVVLGLLVQQVELSAV